MESAKRLTPHVFELMGRLSEVDARDQEECDAVAQLVWNDWAEALWWDMQEEIKAYLEKRNAVK
jgi:hypothetical protein